MLEQDDILVLKCLTTKDAHTVKTRAQSLGFPSMLKVPFIGHAIRNVHIHTHMYFGTAYEAAVAELLQLYKTLKSDSQYVEIEEELSADYR